MSIASIGGIPFRINPSQVTWDYSVNTTVIPTVGGRVVQVLGVTLGDMTIQGLFGQERDGQQRQSWELAEEFQRRVSGLIDLQSQRPTPAQLSGVDPTPMHPTHRFVYSDDSPEARAAGLPVHNWDFNVYIKDLKDVESPSMTVQHSTGRYSYGYTLTLFIQQDNTGKLATVAQDEFISRLSNGLGWKRTAYNGMMTTEELKNYLQSNSPDGTIHGLVLKEFQNAGNGQLPQYGSATNPIPGGVPGLQGGQ